MAVRGARPVGRWVWWGVALLAVPAALAAVGVLVVDGSPVAGPSRHAAAPGADGGAVAGLTTVAAAPGARPTPADHGPAAEHTRIAAALADRPIPFAADSAELTEPATVAVQEVARLLSALPDAPVLVEGHAADTPGGLETARLLSERRADVVAGALEAAGVAGDRIATRGHAAERPLDTVARSRRVEISIR
ncbi:OmpA family protein [Pseudonocardia sp. MH-G8]|uniref:OmpA family protein n=1 Tax=Pseudonocardia sp. MH-G8 TaxID=1854588 RepID=UPI000BA11EC3|nr:OmpA family protein [Pseudonocardia sp. MH-G8]OZM80443.1 hypothetical protein CFP66_20010 [Pseudonocardia sp. MH-G8]